MGEPYIWKDSSHLDVIGANYYMVFGASTYMLTFFRRLAKGSSAKQVFHSSLQCNFESVSSRWISFCQAMTPCAIFLTTDQTIDKISDPSAAQLLSISVTASRTTIEAGTKG